MFGAKGREKNSSSSAAELSCRKPLRFRPLALRPRLSVGFAIIGELPMLVARLIYNPQMSMRNSFYECFVNTARFEGAQRALVLTKRAKLLYNSTRFKELEIFCVHLFLFVKMNIT
jgi:hypothetical protein